MYNFEHKYPMVEDSVNLVDANCPLMGALKGIEVYYVCMASVW